MKMPFCVACGAQNDLHHHHLIPRSMGGAGGETNLITLCKAHHQALHAFTDAVEHGFLVSKGIDRAKGQGVRLGPKPAPMSAFSIRLPKLTPVQQVLIYLYAQDGVTPEELSELRWLDLITDVLRTKFRQITLHVSSQTKIERAIAHLGLSGDGLMLKISALPRAPEGRKPNTIGVWLSRQKNPDTVRPDPRSGIPKKLTRKNAKALFRKAMHPQVVEDANLQS